MRQTNAGVASCPLNDCTAWSQKTFFFGMLDDE
jgi:hypothetical protein